MEKEISDKLFAAAEQARTLAETLGKACHAAQKNREEVLKRILADAPQALGEVATHLGRLFPAVYHRPFQFTLATGQYNPLADDTDDDEYPDEPPAYFTIRLEHAIRVIGGNIQVFDEYDDLPDILFERQTIGKWLIFCSHENSDPVCVLEINDDRSTEIYDVNYWAGNVQDRRGRPSHIVALGTLNTGWQFIGPFPNENDARDFAKTLPGMMAVPLDLRPKKEKKEIP